ncbi:MAG: hypothetical protein J5789_05120, partial [Oscillospiraceae bacterium]|nr:hypothetical protein [Oscillospiraceae bacterium]
MKKRNEQFTPDPAFSRPAALSDETKKSADDFARHLAALLRADKHAHEDEPPRQPQLPDLSDLSPAPDIPPARDETIPSAQKALEPFAEDFSAPESSRTEPEIPKLRSDLSDKPFAPPQEDPSLDEIFNFAPPEEDQEEPPVLFRFEDGPFAETGTPRKEDTIVFPQPEDELLIFPRSTEEPPAFRKPEGETLVFPKQEELEAIAAKAEEVSDFEPDFPEDYLRPQEAQAASPAPLSRDTTGSLPSLEEIFGTVPEPAAPHREESPTEAAPEPQAPYVHPNQTPGRFARRSKLRGLLDNLLAPESPDEFADEAAGEQAETEALPERESAPQSEAVPEGEVLPKPERSSPPEALAEPAALPHPAHPEETAASDAIPPHPRKPSGSAGTGPALTLEELLAAAVPMEEAAPPKAAPPPQAENETP